MKFGGIVTLIGAAMIFTGFMTSFGLPVVAIGGIMSIFNK